jgi:hypothetical protein
MANPAGWSPGDHSTLLSVKVDELPNANAKRTYELTIPFAYRV